VFAEVAQQVLEYLGVPHDQPLKTPKELLADAAVPTPGDGPSESSGDLNAMFDEINNLPADDPLRKAASMTAVVETGAAPAEASIEPGSAHVSNRLPAKVVAAFEAHGGSNSSAADSAAVPLHAVSMAAALRTRPTGSVAVDAGQHVAVPSFAGADLRKVVETAANLGLRVEPVGSGVEREQFPAAGTRVPLGTQVVVRFTR